MLRDIIRENEHPKNNIALKFQEVATFDDDENMPGIGEQPRKRDEPGYGSLNDLLNWYQANREMILDNLGDAPKSIKQ